MLQKLLKLLEHQHFNYQFELIIKNYFCDLGINYIFNQALFMKNILCATL